MSCSNREILDLENTVKVLCSNPSCPTSLLMHSNCFAKFEDSTCMKLSKHARCRGWSDRQVHTIENVSWATLLIRWYERTVKPKSQSNILF